MPEQEFELVNAHLEGESFYWEGSSTGILLSHGFTATTAEVRPLARVLHEHGYTVAGPLLPGHGTTPQDANTRHWGEWVDAVEATYRQLSSRCDRVFIGGESMGGLLALFTASEHPEAVGILTYAPALKVTSSTAPYLARLLGPFIPIQIKTVRDPTPADERWQGYPVNPVKAAAQLFRLQSEVDRRLPSINQPILIVQGRLDPTVHPDVPEIISRKVNSEKVEIQWMENSTHCVALDGEWEQVGEITLRFIDQVLNT
jgi:carboxylesterase